MKKILFYTNQFFGQIGGEDMAYAEPQLFEGMHGSANTFGAPLKDIAEIVATIVCGDNFYAENMETGRAFLLEQIKKYQPDLIIAGPAMFTRITPSFILAIVSSLMMCLVSSVSGQ